jgi:uncharacterized membrane protein YoaK (UPF0700 family)
MNDRIGATLWLLSEGMRDTMVLMLAWAAGSLDAIGYLGLGQIFTANMTGNAVFLGLAVGQGHGLASLRPVAALAGFALGVAAAAALMGKDREQTAWPVGVTRAVLLECVVLTIFTITWHLLGAGRTAESVYVLIGLSAAAMGIQSAAVRRLNVPGIATTYITGTLTSLVSGMIDWIGHTASASFKRAPAGESEAVPAPAIPGIRSTWLQGGVFFIYCLAAVWSGFVQTRTPWFAAISPVLAVALVTIAGWVRGRHRDFAGS